MSTQRPFFASFFGAFRARTNPTFQAKSSTTTSISPSLSTAHVTTTVSNVNPSNANSRSLTTSTVVETIPHTQPSSSQSIPTPASKPSSAFPATFTSTSPGSHTSFYPRSSGASSPVPHNANLSMGSPGPGHVTPNAMTRGRQRRGSDSSNSSGGFMDALGAGEKWYIGGRTAGGDERFYRLGLVTATDGGKRTTSLDRLSL